MHLSSTLHPPFTIKKLILSKKVDKEGMRGGFLAFPL